MMGYLLTVFFCFEIFLFKFLSLIWSVLTILKILSSISNINNYSKSKTAMSMHSLTLSWKLYHDHIRLSTVKDVIFEHVKLKILHCFLQQFQVYAECIPAVDALRDQCNSTFTCSSDFAYKRDSDELTYCRIECTTFDMTCYNYTRNCTKEVG